MLTAEQRMTDHQGRAEEEMVQMGNRVKDAITTCGASLR